MIIDFKKTFSFAFFMVTALSLLAQSEQLASNDNGKPWFKDGEAQIVEAFSNPNQWLRHDLWVETDFDSDADGKLDRMHVAVCRPGQTEDGNLKLPVIYNSSPYFSGVASDEEGVFWEVNHELGEIGPERNHPQVVAENNRPVISNGHVGSWLPRGYIVVHSSSPGTGLSEGAPTVGGENESLAPQAVIEWLTGKRKGYTSPVSDTTVEAFWSSRKVGMLGTSYNGTLALAAACTGVDGLEAIIPVAPNTSYYHYYRSHGLVRSPGGYLGEDIDVLYDYIHSGDPDKRADNNQRIREDILRKGMDRESGDFNEFWASRDYLLKMDKMKAALFMSHGFNDWNVMPEHSYRIYMKAKEMKLPAMFYAHQFGHGGPPPMRLQNRWFTRYLFGINNGVEEEPRAWIVREDNSPKEPSSYVDFPNPAAEVVSLKFIAIDQQNGSLVMEAIEGDMHFVDDYNLSLKDLSTGNFNNRLLFRSAILTEDLHISGLTEVELKLAILNNKAANLSLALVSLPWEEGSKVPITANIITRGWADLQNHKALDKSQELIEGDYYSLRFYLNPDDQIIPKGQQIALVVFSSDKEFTLHPRAGTELSLDLNNSTLHLPIVGGKEQYLKCTAP
jgi:X-Pro dipeptidyl-peptidase